MLQGKADLGIPLEIVLDAGKQIVQRKIDIAGKASGGIGLSHLRRRVVGGCKLVVPLGIAGTERFSGKFVDAVRWIEAKALQGHLGPQIDGVEFFPQWVAEVPQRIPGVRIPSQENQRVPVCPQLVRRDIPAPDIGKSGTPP